MKIAAIVVLAALALASFSVIMGLSVRAQSSQAQVLSYSWYTAPSNTNLAKYSGDLVAVGEIQNVGQNTLGYVVVSGAAYNSSGDLLDTGQANAIASDLLPGQKAPFYLDFTPENSVAQDQSWVPLATNVTVAVTYASITNSTPYSGITVQSSTPNFNNGDYTVTGTILNSGNQAALGVVVVTTFYNSSGTVIGLNFTDYLSNNFAVGATLPFSASPLDNTEALSSAISNYSLLVLAQPVTATATPTPTASPPPTEQPTSSPTATPTGNGSSNGLSSWIYILVIAVIIAVVIAVVAFVWTRRNVPPPPPPPEYQEE